MIRTLALSCAFLLSVSPALAGDLSGLWDVEGSLHDGTPFVGHAVLSPQRAPGRYTVSAQVDCDGGSVRWQATATRAGASLTTRHWRVGTGFNQVLQGNASAQRVTGDYTIESHDGEEVAFAGTLGTPGAQGQARFVRSEQPQVRFEPEVLALLPGEVSAVPLRTAPEGLFDLLWFDGPPKGTCSWRRGDDESLILEAHKPGFYTFAARLGRGGPVVAELEVDVRTDVFTRLLERVKAEANDGDGLVPIVVFDLDDTLFDTRYRTLRILHEYAAEEGEARLETAQPEQVHYELHDTLLEIGYSEAEIDAGLGKDLRYFWLKRFFRDDRLAHDGVYEGAPEYLHALVAAGAEIAYVTGRKVTALEASRAKLIDAGYPVDGQHLFFKPIQVPGQPKLKTSDFKGQVAAEELPKLGEPIGAVDNEPANCNAFIEHLPEGSIVVFMDTLYGPDSPAVVEGVETVRSSAYAEQK